MATRMVTEFGLSPRAGPVSYGFEGQIHLDAAVTAQRSWAEATQHVIDAEVARLVREAEQRALDMLIAHRDDLDALTNRLLEHETVDGAEVYALVGTSSPQPARPRNPELARSGAAA